MLFVLLEVMMYHLVPYKLTQHCALKVSKRILFYPTDDFPTTLSYNALKSKVVILYCTPTEVKTMLGLQKWCSSQKIGKSQSICSKTVINFFLFLAMDTHFNLFPAITFLTHKPNFELQILVWDCFDRHFLPFIARKKNLS